MDLSYRFMIDPDCGVRLVELKPARPGGWGVVTDRRPQFRSRQIETDGRYGSCSTVDAREKVSTYGYSSRRANR